MRITKADLRPGLFLTGGAFPVSGGDVLLRSRAAPAPVSYGAPALPPPSLAEITARIAAAYPHGSGPCPRAARDQTAMTGLALELRLRLRRLQREHQSAPQPVTVALTAPVDQPQVVEGFAATTDIDLDRVKFRRYAFTWTTPVLLYKHIEPAGRIEQLSYDDNGALLIRAVVSHPLARRCSAFSVGAKLLAYELCAAATPEFYALVTSAELVEVSLTDTPANPQALVHRRYPASPASQFYSLLGERVSRLVQLTTLMQETTDDCRHQRRA